MLLCATERCHRGRRDAWSGRRSRLRRGEARTPSGPYIVAPGVVVAALTPIMAPDGLRYLHDVRCSTVRSEQINVRLDDPGPQLPPKVGDAAPGVRIERVGFIWVITPSSILQLV